ncbi:transcriptional regulator [Ammoniphilus oxalaticus]|uniref:Transcriptional regulator n=1 Tax=Ammoniphilus oxalaticus TaxID=66863 RepID=A0A419SNH4_9BACL|nr:transcriptional regulator [Ammoniphilus oxalaticus]RKD25850.1 transcriptional regulator [Ammoniphilus oxalaticus]
MKRLYFASLTLFLAFSLTSCSTQTKVTQPEPLDGAIQDAPENEGTLEEAVSQAILAQYNSSAEAETTTEGHIILDTERINGGVKVYMIASYGAFGFENGIFTIVGGTGSIPTIMTFSKDENGGYTLLEYKEPLDGSLYANSLKEMFPPELHTRLFAAHDEYPELVKQQEEQARAYLKSIGRSAEVSARYVEKELPTIHVEASNRLFGEWAKDRTLIHSCPYWLGTKERIENGERYIYETAQRKMSDGSDLLIFQKKKEDGTIVEEEKYKIVGSEPEFID